MKSGLLIASGVFLLGIAAAAAQTATQPGQTTAPPGQTAAPPAQSAAPPAAASNPAPANTAAAPANTAAAPAKTKAQCAADWKAMRTAKQTAGKRRRVFMRECTGGSTAAKAAKPKSAKPMSPRRQAFHARQVACGKEWKATKAAGKIEPGMKWPKFFSACNKRLKEKQT